MYKRENEAYDLRSAGYQELSDYRFNEFISHSQKLDVSIPAPRQSHSNVSDRADLEQHLKDSEFRDEMRSIVVEKSDPHAERPGSQEVEDIISNEWQEDKEFFEALDTDFNREEIDKIEDEIDQYCIQEYEESYPTEIVEVLNSAYEKLVEKYTNADRTELDAEYYKKMIDTYTSSFIQPHELEPKNIYLLSAASEQPQWVNENHQEIRQILESYSSDKKITETASRKEAEKSLTLKEFLQQLDWFSKEYDDYFRSLPKSRAERLKNQMTKRFVKIGMSYLTHCQQSNS